MLCGGTTLLPGFADRLKKDTKTSHAKFISKNPNSKITGSINVLAPPRRAYNVFAGGATFANILDGMDNWITKKEYEESGFNIVQRKFCNNLQLGN